MICKNTNLEIYCNKCLHTSGEICANLHKNDTEEKYKITYLPVFSVVTVFTRLRSFSSVIGKNVNTVENFNTSVQISDIFQPWYFVFFVK
jgi:hypothetical protein